LVASARADWISSAAATISFSVNGSHAAWIGQIGLDAPVGFQTLGRVIQAAYNHAQPETVQDLRAQAAFFGVHRADQHETGPVGGGDGATPDSVTTLAAASRMASTMSSEKQVDLINESRLRSAWDRMPRRTRKALVDDGAFVDPADHVLQPGVERQLDQPDTIRGNQWLASAYLRAQSGQTAVRCRRTQYLRAGSRNRHRERSTLGRMSSRERMAVVLAVPRGQPAGSHPRMD